MKYGDKVTWMPKPLDKGLLVRTLKMDNIDNITHALQPYGLSPMRGLPLRQSTVSRHMGFEGGTGISTAHSTEKYGKPGTLLKRSLRLNKCPWPNGQRNIRLRITVGFGHTIGANGAGAEPKVYIREWFRDNMEVFQETFSSNVAPATDFMKGLGYKDASASMRVTLTPRDFNPPAGNPLVWDSENGFGRNLHGMYLGQSFLHARRHVHRDARTAVLSLLRNRLSALCDAPSEFLRWNCLCLLCTPTWSRARYWHYSGSCWLGHRLARHRRMARWNSRGRLFDSETE